MTEKDAKQKWCPMTRTILLPRKADDKRGVNPIASNHPGGHGHTCLATGCMAWRAVDDPASSEMHGYCGLAGADMDAVRLAALARNKEAPAGAH